MNGLNLCYRALGVCSSLMLVSACGGTTNLPQSPPRSLGSLVSVSQGLEQTDLTCRACESVLYRFCPSYPNCSDGNDPRAGLVPGKDGTIYGTTEQGGVYNYGTVFQLKPAGSGFTEKVLHSFGKLRDGQSPLAGLILDGHGALYGTTYAGGTPACTYRQYPPGCGTVFMLVPSGSGRYTERMVYRFAGGSDGSRPQASLTFGKNGALYGTTSSGGAYGNGTVFRLTPSGQGYAETILHSFGTLHGGRDGANPLAGLISDNKGALYGTTARGGAYGGGDGTVFKLTPSGSGYSETILHSFGLRGDGDGPEAGLVFGKNGVLYGTTVIGGDFQEGTVFKLTPSQSGYNEAVLYSFASVDGAAPQAGLVVGKNDALYGTAPVGGYKASYGGYGVVFKLAPSKSGYAESVLYKFKGGADGDQPMAGLIFGANGSLYGTTAFGGNSTCGSPGCGTVFEISP